MDKNMPAGGGSAFGGKKRAILLGFLMLGTLSFATAQAAEVLARTPDNPNINISGDQTHRNLYTVGRSVFVGAPTAGDLVAAGGSITVVNSVEQDVMLAGGTVEISGQVGGDVRMAGGNVTINNKIGGDVVVAGGNVTLSDRSEVGGDLLVTGGTVVINGSVHGGIRASGGVITINNAVGSGISVKADQLVIGSNAKITNRISYKGKKEATVEPGAQVAGIDFTRTQQQGVKGAFMAIIAGAVLIKLIAWVLAGLLLIRFRKQTVEKVLTEVSVRPWKNLGIGFLAAIVTTVAIVICFFAFVGYYIGAILAAWFALVLLVSNLVSAIVLGAVIVRLLTRSVQSVVDWQAVVIGVVVWTIIKLIPFVGMLAAGLFFLAVLGVFFTLSRTMISSNQE